MTWTTRDELSFIDSLGTRAWVPSPKAFSEERRLDYLLGYREGLKLRVHWAPISRTEVEAHLNRLIDQLSNHPHKKENA